jgi:DNA-binding GntR family transcriptional regulator
MRNNDLLGNKVYKILKKDLFNGKFEQDYILSESSIARRIGVSRTPVREAIRRLAAERLVVITPNKGIVIRKFLIEELKELLQIRIIIEGFATRLSAKNINKENIEKLKKIVNLEEKIAYKNDYVLFSKLDTKFHNIIIDSCGNKKIKEIYINLREQSFMYRIKSFSKPARLLESMKEAKEIIRALEERKSAKAEKLYQEHINNGYKNILEFESIEGTNLFE